MLAVRRNGFLAASADGHQTWLLVRYSPVGGGLLGLGFGATLFEHDLSAELARIGRSERIVNLATAPLQSVGFEERAAGARLTIDLGAIAVNYRLLRATVGAASCGAVVKADAYGLGATMVAPVLTAAGCRHFFVAHLAEAIALRRHLPRPVAIYVMHGVFAGCEAACEEHDVVPACNSPEQLTRWARHARSVGRRLPVVVQVDTGMSRFGFAAGELARAAEQLASLDLAFVMSHLACADTPDHAANAAQRARFDAVRRQLPAAPATLAASSGIFLGSDFHYDLVRPGAALYGVAPVPGAANPLRPVVRLDAKVVQCRDVAAGTPIGYGHTARTVGPARLATIAVGYADGYLRSGSNQGAAWHGALRLPIMGRVSMDSVVLDVSAAPHLQEGDMVELIGPSRSVDDVAADAGTIGYEVLTSLGQRYHRHYLPADAA